MHKDSQIYDNSTVDPSMVQLTFFQEATPASQTALPACEPEKQMHVTSGRNIAEYIMRLNPDTSLTRTCLEAFLTGCWIRRSATWKLTATPAGRPLLSLRVLRVPFIGGIGSGWLPTPCAQDGNNSTLPPSQLNKRKGLFGTIPSALMHLGQPAGVPINPQFYEWLMGYPTDWTDVSESRH